MTVAYFKREEKGVGLVLSSAYCRWKTGISFDTNIAAKKYEFQKYLFVSCGT